jgi:hypothetical protein
MADGIDEELQNMQSLLEGPKRSLKQYNDPILALVDQSESVFRRQ